MDEPDKEVKKNALSLDWLVGGALSRFGETIDRFTGRGWNPTSSLATSKLIEKLKFLLDEDVRDLGKEGKFVPHVLTLKIQWNKFSADSEDELEKLRDELHAASIDHINDKLYHTYAPLEINIKTDYFTEGVRLTGSFGKFGGDDEEAAVNVTLPNIEIEYSPEGSRASINLDPVEETVQGPVLPVYMMSFELNGRKVAKELDFSKTKRFSIGRGSGNEISVDDASVSKNHASIVLNAEGKVLLADTGSTNGTYLGGERIAYGKAVEILHHAKIRIGSIGLDLVSANDIEPGVQENGELLEQSEIDYRTVKSTQNEIAAGIPVNEPALNTGSLSDVQKPVSEPGPQTQDAEISQNGEDTEK